MLAAGLGDIPPDSLTAAFSLMVLIWADEFGTASRICDAVLHSARERGSMSMVAHTSCSRRCSCGGSGTSKTPPRTALALDFKLATSPPVAVAWAAAFCIDALTGLGRLGDADAVAAVAAQRDPPAGWIHTATFRQARGGLRVAQHRYGEALDDPHRGRGLARARRGQPVARLLAHRCRRRARRAGAPAEAAALAAEQLALARRVGTPATLGGALRAHAAAVRGAGGPGRAQSGRERPG